MGDFWIKVTGKFGAVDVLVRDWVTGDPLPEFSPICGFDNETELIKVGNTTPDMVVSGLYSPQERTCWIVGRDHIVPFYQAMAQKVKRLWGYNIQYDVRTSDKVDPNKTLYKLLDQGVVAEIRSNLNLHWFATRGDVRKDVFSLATAAQKILGMHLDKGEELGDDADRLTFRVGVPVTQSQKKYLAEDCVSSYFLGIEYIEYPTLILQTQAEYVLAGMTLTGIPGDMDVFNYFREKVYHQMDVAAEKLKAFGFPLKAPKETLFIDLLNIRLAKWAKDYQLEVPPLEKTDVTKLYMRRAFLTAIEHIREAQLDNMFEAELLPEDKRTLLNALFGADERGRLGEGNMRKGEKEQWYDFCTDAEIMAFDKSKKEKPLQKLFLRMLDDIFVSGYLYDELTSDLCAYGDDNVSWLDDTQEIGPTKFLQDYLIGMMRDNPKLTLEKTKSGKSWKFGKDDLWRLEDNGIKSDFLIAYADYKHMEKYLSTYLNPGFFGWEDGRVHARYKPMVRTGRTSSGGASKMRNRENIEVKIPGPNAQNFPSRDEEYPLRNYFRAPDGWLYCATDYSSLEMASFAQSCWTRFRVSRLRELINAGICPHYWFAGVIKGLIDPDKMDFRPEAVKELMVMLHENISKAERQFAKVPNFGLPGALGAETLYKQMRVQGHKVTKEEAKDVRDKWLSAFPEMKYHMNPDKVDSADTARYSSVIYDEIEDEDGEVSLEVETEREEDKYNYTATLINGRKRNRCSYNAACNYQFQGLAADGAKMALWGLTRMGLGKYMVNFIHDEVNYLLPVSHVRTVVPQVETAMIYYMRQALPDVLVAVESTVGQYWDKGNPVFAELLYDEKGNAIPCRYGKDENGQKIVVPGSPEYIEKLKQLCRTT